MSDPMDTKLRELTYRLIAMAPEAPPFPEDAMVQLKPDPAPAPTDRRRSPLVWVGAAAVTALVVVGIPLFLLGGPDEPSPTTIPPAIQTTIADNVTPTTAPPTTAPPTTEPTTAPPTTVEPASGEPPSYLSVGFDAMVGAGYRPGRIVTSDSLVVMGGTDADATVTVNGNPAPLNEFGAFQAKVALGTGANTITVEATRGGVAVQELLEVTYLPGTSVEFAYLARVGTDQIIADYAQWLTGDDANQAAFEDGVIGSAEEGVPNDYYIRNVNDRLRTLPVVDDVEVVLVSPVDVGPVAVPVNEWVSLFKPDGTPWDYEAGDDVPVFPGPYFDYYGANTVYTPYWLYLDADGTVIQIEQQYLP